MATITMPSTPTWKQVVARYRKVTSRHQSPFSLESQTQLFTGDAWQFDLYLPPMTEAVAANWISKIYELARDNDNFSFDCSDYVPSGITSPMLVRLISPNVSWAIGDARLFGISFSVEEDQ